MSGLIKQDFDERGKLSVCGLSSDALMDIAVYRIDAYSSRGFASVGCETAILLLDGAVTLSYGRSSVTLTRESVFSGEPWCLHFARGATATVTAIRDSRILVQQAENDREFPTKLYSPDDAVRESVGAETLGGAASRNILTIFDRSNEPLSNMCMGEVVVRPGCWAAYPPHTHRQPEVYYYRFSKPQGFGMSNTGGDAHVITDNSALLVTDGDAHPQVCAPGYSMYYTWMIRHLDGDLWDPTPVYQPEHAWLAGAT